MIKPKYALVSLFLALTLGGALVTSFTPSVKAEVTAAAEAKVGQAAPDFSLTDSHGKKQSLSDYKGKLVVLEWINFDCPFVKKHYNSGNMQKLQDKYTKDGVAWLSINTSKPGKGGNYSSAEVNKQLKKWNAHPTAYLQDDGTVGRLYGAKATPHMFVIDKSGTLVYAGAIDDKDTADEADVKTAKNYVAAALDAEMAGKQVATSLTKAYGCFVHY
jgi:peroxiredoxin